MSGRQGLGELEQWILLALLRLGGEAYGLPVADEILHCTGRSLNPGTLYPTLARLQKKGLVSSYRGEPTPERGGRAKRYFTLQPAGMEALRESYRQWSALASGVETALEESS